MSYQTARTWTAAKSPKEPLEPTVIAICRALDASPAWLRYGVGLPRPAPDIEQLRALDDREVVDVISTHVADQGGASDAEKVAEFYRLVVMVGKGAELVQKADEWRNQHFGYVESNESPHRAGDTRSRRASENRKK